jgi:uncharacterized protein YndB with AHSA1/START domain
MAELTREVMIDAPPATIFPFLTETDQWLRWEGTEGELDPRPGGAFRVLVAGAYGSAGEFVEVVPDERVVFTFGWDDPELGIPPGSTTVEITLHPEGDKTRLRLVHRGLPDGTGMGSVDAHTHGWDHYLGRLAVVAGGGRVGPDTGPGAPPGG